MQDSEIKIPLKEVLLKGHIAMDPSVNSVH